MLAVELSTCRFDGVGLTLQMSKNVMRNEDRTPESDTSCLDKGAGLSCPALSACSSLSKDEELNDLGHIVHGNETFFRRTDRRFLFGGFFGIVDNDRDGSVTS